MLDTGHEELFVLMKLLAQPGEPVGPAPDRWAEGRWLADVDAGLFERFADGSLGVGFARLEASAGGNPPNFCGFAAAAGKQEQTVIGVE